MLAQLTAEPFAGYRISVDKEGSFRANFQDVFEQVVAGGVTTEIKDLHLRAQRDRRVR